MKPRIANIRPSTTCLMSVAVTLSLVGGCASQMSAEPVNKFKIEFGRIERVDSLNQTVDQATTIHWTQGVTEPRVGASVESLAKRRFSLAYTINRMGDDKSAAVELERDGWWTIGSPVNNDYKAFIYSDKIKYTPGRYLFSVLIDGKVAKRFEFTIVGASRAGER